MNIPSKVTSYWGWLFLITSLVGSEILKRSCFSKNIFSKFSNNFFINFEPGPCERYISAICSLFVASSAFLSSRTRIKRGNRSEIPFQKVLDFSWGNFRSVFYARISCCFFSRSVIDSLNLIFASWSGAKMCCWEFVTWGWGDSLESAKPSHGLSRFLSKTDIQTWWRNNSVMSNRTHNTRILSKTFLPQTKIQISELGYLSPLSKKSKTETRVKNELYLDFVDKSAGGHMSWWNWEIGALDLPDNLWLEVDIANKRSKLIVCLLWTHKWFQLGRELKIFKTGILAKVYLF